MPRDKGFYVDMSVGYVADLTKTGLTPEQVMDWVLFFLDCLDEAMVKQSVDATDLVDWEDQIYRLEGALARHRYSESWPKPASIWESEEDDAPAL